MTAEVIFCPACRSAPLLAIELPDKGKWTCSGQCGWETQWSALLAEGKPFPPPTRTAQEG